MNSTVTPHFESMTTGRLLDRVFRLYAANFPLMLGIAASAYVPLYALQLLLQAFGGPSEGNLTMAFFQFIFVLLWVTLTFPIATGAATYAISERYLGHEVMVSEAFARALKRLWTLSIAQLEAGLRVMIGFLLLIIPGILWSLSYSLVVPVVIVEGQKAAPSVRRSSDLVKGNRMKVFLVLVVVSVIQGLAGYGVETLSGQFFDAASSSGALILTALGQVAQILVTPFLIIADILLYYDFRIRKEGFDLEMLSRDLAAVAEGAGSLSPTPSR